MRSYDFAPLWRSSVGFDRIFDLINNNSRLLEGQGDYPPYDIQRVGDEAYRISLALAGFALEELSITAKQNELTITGRKADEADKTYLHKGIAARPFERHFSLEDHVRVEGARFENGLLYIDLVREVPEAMKPRRIEINAEAPKSPQPDRKRTIEHLKAAS